MGTKQNPGAYDCHAKALPDEPIFYLLGRDDCAYSPVLHWADLRESQIIEGIRPAGDRAMVAEARQWVRDARAWRTANWPGRKVEAVRNERQELIDVVGHQTERAERAEAEVKRLTALLTRSWDVIARERAAMIDSLRRLGQTDADVLADKDHEAIEDRAYAEVNMWTALLDDINFALVKAQIATASTALALAVRTCRKCGCTDTHACEGGCWWVSADLCSACDEAFGEWPAEPWVVSEDLEDRGCIFQEGEVDAIAIVDVHRENDDDYVHGTARRIVACVNAMAGIEDPEAFMTSRKAVMAAGQALMTSRRGFMTTDQAREEMGYKEPTDGR